MYVAVTPELEQWLFRYDKDFKVLEPSSLIASVSRKSQGMTLNHPVQDQGAQLPL
jgi:hypothetical protein